MLTTVGRTSAAGLAALAAALICGCGGSGDARVSASTATSAAAKPTPPPVAAPATMPAASTTKRPSRPRREFTFKAQPLPARIRARITGSSWHEGCPVGLGELRYVQMNYWGFDGNLRPGVMIVNTSAVAPVRKAFAKLFAKRFPIRRMHLVDDYDADDYKSIEADNTSSFNCRRATGETRWSEHAYGRAIDVNPIENPYVYADGTTTHPASRPYLDRSQRRPGMAIEGGRLVKAFDAVGWGWGGRWTPATDIQHFSANNR